MSLGRPKTSDSYELEKLFEKHCEQFVNDGKVLPPKDKIWRLLSDEPRDNCSVKKEEKTIYTAALKWYQNMHKAIGMYYHC